MGIAAARLALAWRQRSLAIAVLSGAGLSGTNRSSGSWLGASVVSQIIPQNANRCKTEPGQTAPASNLSQPTQQTNNKPAFALAFFCGSISQEDVNNA